MTDAWWYEDNRETRGPVPLADLVATLAQAPDPQRVLVWREGFGEWRPVARVREVAEQLFRQSPPARPSSSPAPRPRPSVHSVPSAAAGAPALQAAEPELTGIAGWLAVVAMGQVLGPPRALQSIIRYYSALDTDLFQRFPLTAYGEILLNVAFFALILWTSILFFRHSRRFPKFFIAEWIVVGALPLIDLAWVAFTLSIASGSSVAEFLTLDRQDLTQVGAAAIIGPIWAAYILRSRRVANTFVK